MWAIFVLLCCFSPFTRAEDDSIDLDKFQRMLEDAAYDVISKHMDEMARIKPPPPFNMPPDFMRSFRPNTGVGNREELIIDNIKQIPVFEDAGLSQFRYKRFNNTDYLLGKSKQHVMLSVVDTSRRDSFVLSKDEPVLNFASDYASTIKDVVMFTRFVKNSEFFYLAVLTDNTRSSLISIYEIVNNNGILVAVIDLGISSSSNLDAMKVSYVQSQFGGSLIVLLKSTDTATILYRTQGSSELNHYIEIHYPNAVNLETFTIQGHGYVAVSNQEVVEIYKMDQFVQNHLLFDRLSFPQSGLTGLKYFRVGFHHYLATSGNDEQQIFHWNTAEFSSKQTIPLLDVKQVYSVPLSSCRDDVLLIFIRDALMDIYVYSGSEETFIPAERDIPFGFIAHPKSITSFTHKSKAVILITDTNANLQAFMIETSLKDVKDPTLYAGEQMEKIMQDIKIRIEDQTKQIQIIKEVLANAVRSKGDQTITAFQTFDRLQILNGTSVDELVEPMYIKWEDSDLTLDEYKKGAENLEKEVEELERLVAEIERIIPDVVRVDQPTVVTGRKVFTGNVKGPSIVAVSLNLESAAGENLKEIQKEIYRLDKPQEIKGTLYFEQPLTVMGNLDVEKTINGIDISEDVMTTNTKQTSNAQMTFLNKMVIDGNLEVEGKLNDIDIGKEVVTLYGNHNIVGRKTFLNGIYSEIVNTRLLDGIDINELYSNAFTISGDQVVPGLKTFSGSVTAKNITLLGLLNGYNITELADSIVRTDRPAVITGHKTFLDDVAVEGDLTVEGTINGVKIPDDLFLTDVSQVVTGPKSFTGIVNAFDVAVHEKIDGLKIPDDIVTLTKDETISGTLYFTDGVHFGKDIIVENLVDGVDISELAKEALKLNETNELKNAIFFGPVTVTGNLDVRGLVNKVNLKEIVKDIVYKDEFPVLIKSEKHFKKVLADSVDLKHSINGFNIETDFMRVHGDQVINGTKIFKKPVVFNTVFIDNDAISGVNISRLYEDQIALTIRNEVDYDIEFVDHVIVEGNLDVHGRLDGLQIPDDIVLKTHRSNEVIENKVFQGYVNMDNLIVDGDVNVSGTFSGVDLTKFFHERISLTEDQEISGDVWLDNATASKVTVTGLVNGIDIVEFANNVMSKTKDQTITAMKKFSGRVIADGPIITENGVNDVELADVNRRAFKLNEDNVVTAHLQFSDVIVDELMTDNLNEVNITRLSEDSLKKYGKDVQLVTGVTVFNEGFHVEGDILADSVNDLDLPRDVLLKSVPQEITGQFTLKNVEIDGDLEVKGFINGIDLSETAPQIARIDKEIIIESNITFSNTVYVTENIEVSGLVNGIDLKALFDKVLQKDGNQVVPGNKIIKGNVTVLGDLDVGTVNGINWHQFMEDVVIIGKSQKITGHKTFSDIEIRDDMFVTDSLQVGTINGHDLSKFLDDVVYIDEPANITGLVVFKEAVEILGDLNAELINGLKLEIDVITTMCSKNGSIYPQLITGQKTFKDLSVFGNIIVDKVNSYDLNELYKDTLLTDGDQTIPGKKTITGNVVFQADVHPNLVNGKALGKELVTLNTDQEITGPLTFEDDIFVEKDLVVHGLVNEINLTELAMEAVYLDTDQVIQGNYIIETAVVKSDVAVQGTVNGLDLVALDKNATDFWTHTTRSVTEMVKHSEDSCELAKYLQDQLKSSYLVLDGFVTYQQFDSSASFINVKSPEEISLIYLKELEMFGQSIGSTWDINSKKFLPSLPTPTSIARSRSVTIGKEKIEIHIGIYNKDSLVTINDRPAELPRGFKDASVLAKKNKVIIALLFPSRGACDVYTVFGFESSSGFEIENFGSVPVGKEATSIAIFDASGILYLAVSSLQLPPYKKGFSKIFSLVNENWSKVQNIPAAASTHVKHFLYYDHHYLAFINNAAFSETREPKAIQVYRLNTGTNQMLFTLFQKIEFNDAKSIEIFHFGDLSDLYLTTWNETMIQVFRLEGEAGFGKSITLYGKCIKDVKPLLMKKDIYLAVGQQNLKTNEHISSVLYKGILKGSIYSQHNFTYC